jgi:hypothetical protein
MEAKGKQVHIDSMDEEIVARVAAIDVAKDSGMVCTRVPHSTHPGKRTTTVWSVSARISAIIAAADRPAEEHVRSCSRPLRTIGGRSTTFWRHAARWSGWSTPAT